MPSSWCLIFMGSVSCLLQACGGSIQTSVQSLTPDVLGTCELFDEEQVGGER